MPSMLAQQAAALDRLDKQQQQQAAAGEGGSSGSSEAAAAAGDSNKRSSEAAAAEASSSQQQQEGGVQASLEAAGVPSEVAAAADAALKLDDDTLASVSRAIMGRLDIVDLVGRNTAYEVAERVSTGFGVLVVGSGVQGRVRSQINVYRETWITGLVGLARAVMLR